MRKIKIKIKNKKKAMFGLCRSRTRYLLHRATYFPIQNRPRALCTREEEVVAQRRATDAPTGPQIIVEEVVILLCMNRIVTKVDPCSDRGGWQARPVRGVGGEERMKTCLYWFPTPKEGTQ
jgi:hypothetical protein